MNFLFHQERMNLTSFYTLSKNPNKIFWMIFDCLFVCALLSLPHVQVLQESYQSKEGSNSAGNASTISTNNKKSSNLRNIEYSLVRNPQKRRFVYQIEQILSMLMKMLYICIENFLRMKLAEIQIHNDNVFHDHVNVQLTIPRLQR